MGISIHFSGTLANKKSIHLFIDELKDIAQSMQWERDILDEDWAKPSTAKLAHDEHGMQIKGDLSLKGISLNIHPNCEILSLFFNADGILVSPMMMILFNNGDISREELGCSVKTQYASADVHITIINLLKYLQKCYIQDLTVDDEGDYWQTGDRALLIKRLNFHDQKLNELCNSISKIKIDGNAHYSSERLAEILEERLRRA